MEILVVGREASLRRHPEASGLDTSAPVDTEEASGLDTVGLRFPHGHDFSTIPILLAMAQDQYRASAIP